MYLNFDIHISEKRKIRFCELESVMVSLEISHNPLMVILTGATLGVALYCFRLLSKFFKGGVFEGSIKVLGAFSLFFSIAILFDLVVLDWILEPMGIKIIDAHNYHVILEIVFFFGLFYGIRQMYLAWKRLGTR